MDTNRKFGSRLCVIGDQPTKIDQNLKESVSHLAKEMIKAEIGLVHHIIKNDLIDLIAETIKVQGGHVTNFELSTSIQNTKFLDPADEYFSVDSLHECKMRMFQNSDGLIVLPGGVGTLEVLMEYLTWLQRIYQSKPVYLINLDGYWSLLIQLFENMETEQFLPYNFNSRYVLLNNLIDVVPTFQSTYINR
ncbi:LOG family protein [Xanthocytophaga flava]|uniref:LOG family protein n=1 Tax=Xanthocytophaga flava TaxID=3048013 RepID=UPI0028D90196|nr:LOG family protein [Xanthocytophaga flavus]MDJ1473224.1 LOG family protein [Xanthocytophaga flavus]